MPLLTGKSEIITVHAQELAELVFFLVTTGTLGGRNLVDLHPTTDDLLVLTTNVTVVVRVILHHRLPFTFDL